MGVQMCEASGKEDGKDEWLGAMGNNCYGCPICGPNISYSASGFPKYPQCSHCQRSIGPLDPGNSSGNMDQLHSGQ